MAVLNGFKVLNFLAFLTSLFDDAGHGLVVEVNLISTEDVGVPSLLALQEHLAALVGTLHVLDDDTRLNALIEDI